MNFWKDSENKTDLQRTLSWSSLSIALVSTLLISGCNSGGNDSFSFLENGSTTGTGDASIQIVVSSPAVDDYVIKNNDTAETFSVTAIGTGALSYQWTLDDVVMQTGSNPVYNFNASIQTIGVKVLKVNVTDERGSTSKTWNVKVNAPPVFGTPAPVQTTFKQSVGVSQIYTATATDANASETLTYYWTLNGASIGTNSDSYTFTPADTNLGTNTLVLNVRDGAVSDPGTWVVQQSWTVEVNLFYTGCNAMDNEAWFNNASTNPKGFNRTCVFGGNASIGDGLIVSGGASQFRMQPTDIVFTPEGNAFIADVANDVIWFWNKGTTQVDVVGTKVAAGTLAVVVGNGIQAAATAGRYPRESSLNEPHGVAWDGTNLLIGEYNSSRLTRIGPTGAGGRYLVSVISGTCSQVIGVRHKAAGTNPGFYAACSQNTGGTGNRIVRVETTGWTMAGVLGDGNNASDADGAIATTRRIQQPRGIAVDGEGNVYFTEWAPCRVRMMNYSGSTRTLFSGGQLVTIPNGSVGSLSPGGCSTVLGNLTNGAGGVTLGTGGAIRFNRPWGIAVKTSVSLGRVFGRIYVAAYGDNSNGHRIAYLNLDDTTTPVMGSLSVNGLSGRHLIASGTGGFLNASDAKTGRINNPYAIAIDPSDDDLYIADYSNFRIRRVDDQDNQMTTVIGLGSATRVGTAGNGTEYTTADIFSNPRFVTYSAVDGIAFVSDSGNNRIRAISKFGINTTAVGGTAGAPAGEDEIPANVSMTTPGQSVLIGTTSLFGGHLAYADTGNHCVRLWNRSAAAITLFNVTVQAGRVSTIAGTCGTTNNGNLETGQATAGNALNSPHGLAFVDDELYISDTSNHCIKKVAMSGVNAGVISTVGGACTSSGNADGNATATARLNNPAGLSYIHYINPTTGSTQFTKGILIADRSNNRIRMLKLSGTGPFAGTSIATGNIDTVAGSTGGDHDEGNSATNILLNAPYAVTAVGNRRYCFTNSGYHNVRCVDGFLTITGTVLGAPQGTGSSTTYFFGRAPMSPTDQNDRLGYIDSKYTVTTAGTEWTPGNSDPFEPFGTVITPWGVTAIDDKSILVIEQGASSTVRKVRLPSL